MTLRYRPAQAALLLGAAAASDAAAAPAASVATMAVAAAAGYAPEGLRTSAAAHDELLRYLAAYRQEYRTDSFVHLMTYVNQHRGNH